MLNWGRVMCEDSELETLGYKELEEVQMREIEVQQKILL